MRKFLFLIAILGLLAYGGTAIADTNYLLAKKDKAKKEHKIKKEKKKGPSAQAYEHANPNARFKRYDDYTPKEKEKLNKKKWGDMSKEEQGAVSDKYKKEKEKLDEIMRGKKRLEDIFKPKK